MAPSSTPTVRRVTTGIVVGGVHGFTFQPGSYWAFTEPRDIPAVVLANSEPVTDTFGIAPITRFNAADYAFRTAPPPPPPPDPVLMTRDQVCAAMGWSDADWQTAVQYGGFPVARFMNTDGAGLWEPADLTRFREAHAALAHTTGVAGSR